MLQRIRRRGNCREMLPRDYSLGTALTSSKHNFSTLSCQITDSAPAIVRDFLVAWCWVFSYQALTRHASREWSPHSKPYHSSLQRSAMFYLVPAGRLQTKFRNFMTRTKCIPIMYRCKTILIDLKSLLLI